MSTPSSSPPADPAAATSTPVPSSYGKNVGTTPDPWDECARLEYGGDRSFASSVNQQVVGTAPEGRAKLEARLVEVLALPHCTGAGRAFLCRMLALVGSAASVPALAALVRDPKSADAARAALEAIPGAEAGAALREALGFLAGDAKAGLIGSIAARREPAARPALAALAESPDEPAIVREAARRALACLEDE